MNLYSFPSLVVPHLLPGGVPGRAGGDAQVELHLPQPDNIRPGNNIKMDIHMKILQSDRLFICNFECESSTVIVQLIPQHHQTDDWTIKPTWALCYVKTLYFQFVIEFDRSLFESVMSSSQNIISVGAGWIQPSPEHT